MTTLLGIEFNNLPPSHQLLSFLISPWASQAVSVAAKLGISDLLKDGPKTVNDLASITQTDPHTLYRLLRALASIGIYEEKQDTFSNSTLSQELLSDKFGNIKDYAIMAGEKYRALPWLELEHSVRTGGNAFEKAFGMTLYDYMDSHAEDSKNFNGAMDSTTTGYTEEFLRDLDCSTLSKFCDAGGGKGGLLYALLRKYSHLKGVLFDQARVIDNFTIENEFKTRMELKVGDFFVAETFPQGCDAFIYKRVIHDHDDERAHKILTNTHKALSDTGTLFIVDRLIKNKDGPDFAKWFDLQVMINCTGGKLRTELEWSVLLKQTGFQIMKIIFQKRHDIIIAKKTVIEV